MPDLFSPELDRELEQLRTTLIPPPKKPDRIPFWVECGFLFVCFLGLVAWMALCGWLWNAIAELVK